MLVPEILTGLPKNTKPRPKAEFKPDEFDKAVYEHGYRLWWSRAAECPCTGNDQTDQADPVCALCNGTRYYYLLPDEPAEIEGVDVAGNKIEVNDANDAIGIQGIITSTTADPQVYERFGEWLFGTAKLTTNRYNRIGYRDKLVSRDSTTSFSHLFTADGGTEVIVTGMRATNGLWSPITKVNKLRSLATEYVDEINYRVTETGTVEWLTTAPISGTKISIHAQFNPTWIVMDHVYAIRDTMVAKKNLAKTLKDQHTRLPIHAVIKLDFLLDS